jgi:Secretion system C-terminal sorting domain
MKKFLFLLSLCFTQTFIAQNLPYSFNVLDEPYTPLTDSISISVGEIWDDPEYFVPIGFTIQVIDEAWSQLLITAPGALCIGDFQSDSIHLLIPVLEDICDVGLSTGVSGSPISYKVEGEPGSQIFKVEWSNVGFYEEYYQSNTNFNTFSFQLWLYEGTHVIEYRFGPSAVKGGNFFQFGGPMSCVGEDFVNGQKNAWQNLWYTSGDPQTPSIALMDPNDFMSVTPLTGLPASGTVYHFGPLFVGQEEIQTVGLKIFPTLVTDKLWIQTDEQKTQRMELLDISGQLVESHLLQNKLEHLDVSHLARGVYFVRIDGVGVQRFIKQ